MLDARAAYIPHIHKLTNKAFAHNVQSAGMREMEGY